MIRSSSFLLRSVDDFTSLDERFSAVAALVLAFKAFECFKRVLEVGADAFANEECLYVSSGK